MLEFVVWCKTRLTVNAMAVKAANKSQSGSTWKPGACTYQNTIDHTCSKMGRSTVGRGANILPLLALRNYFKNKGIHCI